MRIRSKLLLSFSVICAFALAIGLVGYWGMTSIKNELDRMGEDELPKVKNILTLEESLVSVNMVENILTSSKRYDSICSTCDPASSIKSCINSSFLSNQITSVTRFTFINPQKLPYQYSGSIL
jgi:hypothetical protein